jgi:hypothetical protein
MSQQEDLKELLSQITFNTVQAIQVNGSPQQRAFSWLHQDPMYFDYPQRRIVQRFALATLYYAGSTSVSSQTSDLTTEALQTWMDYDTNECTWFTSWYNNRLACGSDGVIKFLALINIGLSGTIPSELALLTKLNALLLHDNQMSGTIPREFGEWTSLCKFFHVGVYMEHGNYFFQLTQTHTHTFAATTTTTIFLAILDLHSNFLSGRIPEWKNIPKLTQLNLSSNQLTGPIPANTANLSILTSMDLSDNNLVGNMPSGVCNDSFVVLAADCDQVYCNCCTNCQSQGAIPTLDPTPGPSPFSVSAPDPTPSPVSDTSCTNRIQTSKSCFTLGEGISVTFTNCDPVGNDWVGLFDANENDPIDPFLWEWSCGSQTCFGAVPEGSLNLGGSSVGTQNWPLQLGTYKLWLFQRGVSGGPYPILAESDAVTISNSC